MRNQRLKTQKNSVSIVSMFYFLCLYITIKKSSFVFLRYDLFDPPFVYCCSFSSRMVNKMVDFVMKKFMLGCRLSVEANAKNVREKTTKCSLKTTEVLFDVDGHVLT